LAIFLPELPMSGQKRILVVSRDLMVLQTRKLMLGAYFEVNAAGRVVEATMLLAKHQFNLIVLCYTLSDDDCRKIIAATEQHCAAAKFLKLTVMGQAASAADIRPYVLAAEAGPFILVKKAAELLGFEFKSKGRMVAVGQPDLIPIPSNA
jgi:DNA-binding NtrC family response regulator